MPHLPHAEPPEFEPPEEGMGRFYVAVLVIVAALACTGACIMAQLLDPAVNP